MYFQFTNQNYSTCTVRYRMFSPLNSGAMFGCGTGKNGMEFDSYVKCGVVITMGRDEISDPDSDTGFLYDRPLT